MLDQLETGENSSKIAERIRKREAELEELKRQLQKEQAEQKIIDPAIARNFLISIRDGSIDDIEYQKLLINTLVDRIYLYDDHFRIQLTNSGNKGKTTNRGSHEIERYFATSSSTTRNIGTPFFQKSNFALNRAFFSPVCPRWNMLIKVTVKQIIYISIHCILWRGSKCCYVEN